MDKKNHKTVSQYSDTHYPVQNPGPYFTSGTEIIPAVDLVNRCKIGQEKYALTAEKCVELSQDRKRSFFRSV